MPTDFLRACGTFIQLNTIAAATYKVRPSRESAAIERDLNARRRAASVPQDREVWPQLILHLTTGADLLVSGREAREIVGALNALVPPDRHFGPPIDEYIGTPELGNER